MGLFQTVPSTVSKKLQSKVISDPIIYNSKSKDYDKDTIFFVFEKMYTMKQLKQFKTLIDNKYPNLHYVFMTSLIIDVAEEDMKGGIVNFYVKNGVDIQSIIPKNSKVITLGRAIYRITETDDLMYPDFIDEITYINSFYSPDLESTVYPIYPLDMWLTKDNFERIHCLAQINRCVDFTPKRERLRKNIHFTIGDTTKFFNDFKDKKIMSFDIETSGLNWRKDRIGDVTIAFNNHEGYHLFWKDINPKELSVFLNNKKLIMMNGKFDSKFIIKNGVDRESVEIIDIWNMMHVLNESVSSNSLKSGTWRFTKFGGYDRALDVYKKKYKVESYIDDIPDSIRIPYAIDDAIETFEIYEKINEYFDYIDKNYPLDNGWGIKRYFYDSVTPAVNMFLDVELNGMDINYEELKAISKELKEEIRTIEDELYKAFKTDRTKLNVYSTDQLSALIENLGWKIEEYGKKGIPLTNDDCLQRWSKQGHKEADILLRLRGKTALMNTFVGTEEEGNGYFQYLAKEEDSYRVYPTVNPMLASSGRSKHRKPNLAQIPARGEGAKKIRRMFQPKDKDYVFLSADASGLQLRIGALLSKDKVMRDVFINQGGDLHSMTAEVLFGSLLSYKELEDGKIDIIKGKKDGYYPLKFKEFSKFRKFNELVNLYRFKAKGSNFGNLFGAGSETIKTQSIDPEWSIEDCNDYIKANHLERRLEFHKDKYSTRYKNEDLEFHSRTMTVAEDTRTKFFEMYTGLASWIEETKSLATKQGFVQSIYGAFRRLPYLLYQGKDSDHRLIANLLNISLNSPVQNVESVQMNRMMTTVNNYIRQDQLKSMFTFAVHDAVECVFHKDELEVLSTLIKTEFEKDFPEYEGIPFEMEGNVAEYWGTYKTDKWELWDMGHDWEKYIK